MNNNIKQIQQSKWLIQGEERMQFVEIVELPAEVRHAFGEYQLKITEMQFGPETSDIHEEVKELIMEAYAARPWTGYFESAQDTDMLASLLSKYGIAYKQTELNFS